MDNKTETAEWIEKPEQIRLDSIWEEPEYTTIYHISYSRCKKPSPGQGKYKYCPHCGSEMRNGK